MSGVSIFLKNALTDYRPRILCSSFFITRPLRPAFNSEACHFGARKVIILLSPLVITRRGSEDRYAKFRSINIIRAPSVC